MQLFVSLIEFQSTPPVKAATTQSFFAKLDLAISIHAAREGGDGTLPAALEAKYQISIHAAREGGDDVARHFENGALISIHAAREGGDCKGIRLYLQPFHFNPRRP